MRLPPAFVEKVDGPNTQMGISLMLLVTPIMWIITATCQIHDEDPSAAPWRYTGIGALMVASWLGSVLTAYKKVLVSEIALIAVCVFIIVGSVVSWLLAPGDVPSLYVIIGLVPPLQVAINLREPKFFYSIALFGAVGVAILILMAGLEWRETILVFVMVGVPYAVAATYLRKTMYEVEEHLRALQRLSLQDPLTGALNRRGLREALAQRRHLGMPEMQVWLVLIDLDNFKTVNDRDGHNAGDEVLVEVAQLVREQLRGPEILARTGGEEFCIVTSSDGVALAERVRHEVANAQFKATSEKVTTSAGVIGPVFSHQVHPDEVWSYIDMADAALYRAKENGRDRVEQGQVVAQRVEMRELPPQPEPDQRLIAEQLNRRGLVPGARAIFASVFAVMFLLGTLNFTRGEVPVHPIVSIGMVLFAILSVTLTYYSGRVIWHDFVMLLSYDLVVLLFSLVSSPYTGSIAVVILLPTVIISTMIMPPRLNVIHTVAVCAMALFMFLSPPVPHIFVALAFGILAAIMLSGVSAIVFIYGNYDSLVEARVRSATLRDPLTGAYNRRGLKYAFEQLPPGIHTVAVLDVDKFKSINDSFGHAYGDAALGALVEGLCREYGSASIVSRIGGDEFVVVTQRDIPPGIERVVHDLNAAGFKFTMTVGVTEFEAPTNRNLWDVVREADHVLIERREKARQHAGL